MHCTKMQKNIISSFFTGVECPLYYSIKPSNNKILLSDRCVAVAKSRDEEEEGCRSLKTMSWSSSPLDPYLSSRASNRRVLLIFYH